MWLVCQSNGITNWIIGSNRRHSLLIGVLTRIAGILFIIEMIGSTIIIIPKGFVGGCELPLLVLSISASLILTGAGKASIE